MIKPGTLVWCQDDAHPTGRLGVVICYIPEYDTYRLYINGKISPGWKASWLAVINE